MVFQFQKQIPDKKVYLTFPQHPATTLAHNVDNLLIKKFRVDKHV